MQKPFVRYHQVADILRARIGDSAYPLRSKLPGEAALAQELTVSRPTIKSAVRMLEKEGLIQCRPSIGSFVVRHPDAGFFIGLVVPDLQDPFHGEVISELDRAVRDINGSLMVAESGTGLKDEQAAIDRLAARGVNGILLTRALAVQKMRLPKTRVPVVFMGGVPLRGICDGVTIDNNAGIAALLNHLAATGCRTLGYVAAGITDPKDDPRHTALLVYAPKKNLNIPDKMQIFESAPGLEGGRAAMRKLLRHRLPDAVVCFNDWTALGVIREAMAGGVNVPGKLRVTGFDNILISRYVPVPITTIDYRVPLYARTAFDLLRKRMESGVAPMRHNVQRIQGELLARESA